MGPWYLERRLFPTGTSTEYKRLEDGGRQWKAISAISRFTTRSLRQPALDWIRVNH